MTKEELEKRAFAEADKVVIGKGMDKRAVVYLRHLLKSMYVDGAISETELLSQHILELQAYKGELIDKVKELEVQNEKMKCCGNCEWRAKDVCNGNNTCGLKEWKFDEGRR